MTKPRRLRKARAKRYDGLPKDAHRLPTGGYVTKPVGGVTANGRHVYVQGIRRDDPDVRSLARAFLRLAEDLADQERQADNSDLAA